jgi:tetratricopeptide (TPR) repeat protein/two-component sensor histidine kinase
MTVRNKAKDKPLRKKKRVIQRKKMSSKSSVSIDRKVVEDELERSREELRNLTRHLQSVREEERTHIAREMHDELGQTLTVLKLDLLGLKDSLPKGKKSLLNKTESMLTLAESSLQTVRRISSELRPKILDDLGLPEAMKWQGEEFQNRTGIKCSVSIDPENMELDKEVSTALFRIFQESLTNVARYAKASKVDVKLVQMGGVLELNIQDNGKGIVDEDGSKEKSFGLIGMRERVRYLGGEFKIDGKKKKGTIITVKIPMQEAMGRPLLTAPKMVGREKELRRLRVLLESVQRKIDIPVCPPKIVLINGEAGIGKSRLVREFQQEVLSRGGIVLIGNCYEETQSIPYYPYRDALKRFFEINNEEAISILKKIPDYSQWELSRILPGMKELKLPKFERAPNKYRLYEAVRLFLENISSRIGLFIIEDLHWADEASLDLFYYLVRNVEAKRDGAMAPYLLLGTYRTEEIESNLGIGKLTATLKKEDLYEEITLHPLPRKEITTLLNQISPGVEQSKQFQDDLYKKTEGNPFFVEELLRSFRDDERRGELRYVPTIKDIPQSIQSVLKRRIGSLTPEMKEVLACGALIGDEFDFEVLRTSRLSERFRFIHSLMSDVLYDRIGKVKRRLLHGKVGEALEDIYAGRLEVLNGQLSYHFEKGEKWEKAVTYALKSAKHAKEVYANQETIRMYEKARELLPRISGRQTFLSVIETEITIAKELGDVYKNTSDYEKSHHEFQRMEEFARRKGDEKKEGEALHKRSGIYLLQGNFDEALVYGERAYEILKKINDKKEMAGSLISIGNVHSYRGDCQEALKYFMESLTMQKEIGDKWGMTASLNNSGNVHMNRGNYEEALKCLEESLTIKRAIGDKSGMAISLGNIGVIHKKRGNYEDALKCYEESLRVDRDIGRIEGVAVNLSNIGIVHNLRGNNEEALKCYEESLRINRKIGNKRSMASALSNIGVIHTERRDYGEGLKYIEESMRINREIGRKLFISLNLDNIGKIHDEWGKYGEALKYYEESLKILRESGIKRNTVAKIVHVHRIRGDYGKALVCNEEYLKIAIEIGNKEFIIDSLLETGSLHQSLYDFEKALDCHMKSLVLMEKMGLLSTLRAEVLTEIGSDYHELGDEEKALQYLKEAFEKVVEFELRMVEPLVLAPLSEVWLSKRDFAKASEYCERLLRMADEEKLKGHLARGKKIKGEILFSKAIYKYQAPNSKQIRNSKSKIPNKETKSKLIKKAEVELKEALRIAEEIGVKPLKWQIHASLARLYVSGLSGFRDSSVKAKEHYTSAKGIIQKIASSIGDEKLKKTFLNAKQVKSVAVAVSSSSIKPKSTNP